MYLATPHKVLTAGGALLDSTAEGVLQGFVTDDYGDQILIRFDIVVVLGIGCNLFSVMTAAKKDILTMFDYENPRLEGSNVTVSLRSESGDLYSFVMDLRGGGIWRQGASRERSCHCPGVATATGSSPCTEPEHSTQARQHWYHNRGGCLGLRCLHLGEGPISCSSQDRQPQGPPAFSAVLRGSDRVLYASGHKRLQVRQQGNRRVHQVDRRLLIDQQETSSSTVRRLDDHPLRRPHRSLARRQ